MSNEKSVLPWNKSATRFWWIRHAPVTHLHDVMYGTMDVEADVSDTARFDELARRLPENAPWYTSHLKRTHQTADSVAKAGLKPLQRFETELIGEMDFGDSTGKTHAELIEQRSDPYVGFWPVSPVDTPSSGESMEDLCKRVGVFVQECAAKHAGEDVLVFSHMGPILAALANALSLDLHNSVSFSINNLSITQIHHFAGLQPGAPEYRVMKVAEM